MTDFHSYTYLFTYFTARIYISIYKSVDMNNNNLFCANFNSKRCLGSNLILIVLMKEYFLSS